MARLLLVLLVAASLSGCAFYGGAGTATMTNGRIDARGAGTSAGIDATGPYARTASGRIVVE